MKTKNILSTIVLLLALQTFAQKNLYYGVNGAIQINTAILPDLSINSNMIKLLNGDDLVKGEPQLADFTFNYKIGVFAKYEDGFGFTNLELNYTTTQIKKAIKINSGGILNPITFYTLDRNYAYFDASLSYNIYLYKGLYFGLGATTSSLLSHTGSPNPEKNDFRAFTGLGVKLGNNITIDVKGVLGINEVYNDSYIHHIMIPITVSIPIN